MSNPFSFMAGLSQINSSAGPSNAAGNMAALSHNLTLGNLPFSALLQTSGGGQGLPGLPFPPHMQSALGVGMGPLGGGMLGQARVGPSIPRGPADCVPSRQSFNEIEVISENGKENENSSLPFQSNRERKEKTHRDSRKRLKTTSFAESDDDDIMVLSNSPSISSNEANEQREANLHQSNVWDNSGGPIPSMGFPMVGNSSSSLVNSSLYSGDASSFLAAMGSQMPFDFGLIPAGVMGNLSSQTKEPIHLKSCTLFPPNPQAPLPTTRERPCGCKTVFVGGLAENITEDVLKEIFERCGSILTIRMSKKNFAHVRFDRECYVDNAILLSGYRIRLNNQKPDVSSGSNTTSGRLHVDFAQARDDQYEYECQARRLERELRHRQRIEEDKWRPPSPPPVPHYAEHEAHVVIEQLKNEERFGRAIQILAVWLERGDCSKRNSNGFYSMIQSAHAHLRRLSSEKAQLEEEARRTHETLRQRYHHLTTQLGEMERLFQAASHQKAWDHFTRAQRKSLESWKKHVMDLKAEPTVDFLTNGNKGDDNMDLSDSESEEPRRCKADASEKSIANLREENDSLRCQLEAYKNEVEIIRSDMKLELQVKELLVKNQEEEVKLLKSKLLTSSNQSPTDPIETLTDDRSTKLIGLLSIYLSVQHLGANLTDIHEYTKKSDCSYTKEEVENVLVRNKQLFSNTADLWRFKLFFQ